MELIISGTLAAHKAEIMGVVKHRIRERFRACEVDIGEAEVCTIARMSIEIGAADSSEVYRTLSHQGPRSSDFGQVSR